MYAHFKRFLILSALSQFLFFAVPAGAYNVTVSPAASNAGAFVGNVWTPTGPGDSNLSFADLDARLATGDVEIITNGAGNITVVAFFPYTQAVPRLLTLSAQGTVTIQGIQASIAALSVVANASGTVTVNAAGTTLHGGSFSSSGTDFICQHSGLNTGGGNANINHTGTVTITDGGISTGGGDLTSAGTNFSSTAPIDTGGGAFALNHSGTVNFNGPTLNTGGGAFTSSGSDFSSVSLISTGSGAVMLNHTGAVTFSGPGLNTGTEPPTSWGPLTSYGTDFTVQAGGAQTGEVTLHHTGAVALTGGGLNTHNSDFTSYGTNNNFLAADNGLVPGTGDVTIDHPGGSVTFSGAQLTMLGGRFASSGTVFSSSNGINTNGGDVLLNHSGTVTFSGPGLNTGGGAVTGSAGNLFIQHGGLHTDNGAVTLNCAGNITVSDFGGVTTNGGSILMESGQLILINAGSVFSSGGPNDGGDITLRAFMGITADSAIDSSPGSGGILSLEGNTAAIHLNLAPVLGGGNITLYVDPSSASIPTLSEWGMILMSLFLLGAALKIFRKNSVFSSPA